MIRDIFNTYRQAFRVFIRQRSRPRSYEEAEDKRLFWSKIYLLLGFGAMIIATYITGKEKINFSYSEDKSKEQAVLEKLFDNPRRVVKFKNFEKVSEYDFVPVSTTTVTDKSNSETE